MNMREAFINAANDLVEKDTKVSLILGGISVASFSDAINKYPKRVFDAGIMEQTGIGIAAGMSISGMIPIYHTIAPFLAERAYEQLKIDFGYQKLGGNFVSNGASIDYSSFGATHQCPAEINVIKQIPNMQIIVPGTAHEFETLFRDNYNNGCATYYRLCRDMNRNDQNVELGHANVICKGDDATIIAVGPMLDMVLGAIEGLNVTVLYYTSIEPFDKETLLINSSSRKIMICEPYYEGGILYDVIKLFNGQPISIQQFGLPHEFCSHYGSTIENMNYWNLTIKDLRNRLEGLINR
ncbi:transketolase family protein [Butyrivibrio sp. FCS006]|uniref:transketolase family protein n=1 Tax=Butyrivibrio sp. FCS006 TaxID=1280684 RepID=UPI00040826D4|nr:transketolase C-terminal domain-containing protein [Butyrivibrio sp. FCS006]